jgi:RHH-type proline utilization regulon transcriptional repressor/proline dehydrogenase/delta 1-pyrroline-5-carboxylate dehydrogenase
MRTSTAFAAFAPPFQEQTPLRRAITAAYRRDEAQCLAPLLAAASMEPSLRERIRVTASDLVMALRESDKASTVQALMQEYSLSSEEGVALMCLAEALLRIPDAETRDALIRDKIGGRQWAAHFGRDRSLFVNAATWSLVVTGKLLGSDDDRSLDASLSRLIGRVGTPVIRRCVDSIMQVLGRQFVIGETIDDALKRASLMEAKGFRFSFDMLGEAAVTAADADRYFHDYEAAIHAIGAASGGRGIQEGPGISIKLSALHPRYSRSQLQRVAQELLPRVRELALLAKCYGIGLNIDAEEQDRLEVSLDILELLALDPRLHGWDGLGFVVQAYGKRCPFVIDWIIDLARRTDRRIMVRLVKGAYWDSEIKKAQVDGLVDFPVYTRKVHTDVAYIACAKKLLAALDVVYPQFATHNAQTIATIYHLAGPDAAADAYEFQCLHGMGELLYEQVVGNDKLGRPCRIYAPVGTHETLLAYLVRRLLENGANTSFVNRISNPDVSVDELIADPVEVASAMPSPGARHEQIALPANIYPDRRNSMGIDLSDESELEKLTLALRESATIGWHAEPKIAGITQHKADLCIVVNPADGGDRVGTVVFADEQEALHAARVAMQASSKWAERPVEERAALLERAADLMQARMPILMGLLVREAGKSVANAISEVREAIDFLRYYALQARTTFGPSHKPLGPITCISPWNFPLAIFTGQIAAAAVAGNPVLAKPAEETPLIAAEAVRLLHSAGIPEDVLQLLPGEGDIGAALVGAPETAGVIFTGSTDVARLIQKQLAARLSREGRPIPFIAETGGQNAMIVDSSALTEQVVADVIASAFDSAGQRCSALRVLCLQEDIADRTLTMLKGALRELRIGSTDELAVDIGPVITAEAQRSINKYIDAMRARGFPVEQQVLPADSEKGTFVPPTIIEIERLSDLEREVFGPVLHVIRFRRESIDELIDAINAMGYGLTFGLHTRVEEAVTHVTSRIKAGNLYVNRNMIGAVVGVQPFGGSGLSGTGPKAGGPLYVGRLVQEPPRVVPASHITIEPLADFAEWLTGLGLREAAATALAYGEMTPLGHEQELPGPVGERNVYSLHPRGPILLRPSTLEGLFEQMAAVLATGNDGVVDGMDLPADLPDSVKQRFSKVRNQRCSTALIEGDASAITSLLQEVARLPGPVLTVHAALAGQRPAYRLEWLLEERTVSINTTAAGGNASLMMIG